MLSAMPKALRRSSPITPGLAPLNCSPVPSQVLLLCTGALGSRAPRQGDQCITSAGHDRVTRPPAAELPVAG